MKFHEISRKEAQISWNLRRSVSSFQALHFAGIAWTFWSTLYVYLVDRPVSPKPGRIASILIDSRMIHRRGRCVAMTTDGFWGGPKSEGFNSKCVWNQRPERLSPESGAHGFSWRTHENTLPAPSIPPMVSTEYIRVPGTGTPHFPLLVVSSST